MNLVCVMLGVGYIYYISSYQYGKLTKLTLGLKRKRYEEMKESTKLQLFKLYFIQFCFAINIHIIYDCIHDVF